MKKVFLVVMVTIADVAAIAATTAPSAPVYLTVNGSPVASADKVTALTGEQVTFTAVPTGTAPAGGYGYQWAKGGADIAGATTNPLVISTASLTDTGDYLCRVTNAVGAMNSNTVSLSIYQKLTITQSPTGQSVVIGQTATFSIITIGAGTLSYQWQENGSDVGSNSPTYTHANCQLADDGKQVACVVTCTDPAGGQMVTSPSATLSVRADTEAPTLDLYYTNGSSGLSLSFNAHGVTLPTLIGGTSDWATGNISVMGVRFIASVNTFVSSGSSPAPITATGDHSSSLANTVINGFVGKIAPYFVEGATNKYLSRAVLRVRLSKDGGPLTELTRSDGNYYDLNLGP